MSIPQANTIKKTRFLRGKWRFRGFLKVFFDEKYSFPFMLLLRLF